VTIPERSRKAVLARSGNRCELCGRPATNTHHRRPRGGGGSKDPATNLPANLLRLCGSGTVGCHALIESRRTWAYDLGLLVHQGQDPSRVPVRFNASWVLLDNRGGMTPCAPPSDQTGDAA
jgi:5-methylcytosine-specific restriction protein A